MLFPPIDVAVLIRDVNASNEAVEDQCLRTRQAADIADRSACAADQAVTEAVRKEVAAPTARAAAATGDPGSHNRGLGRPGLLFRSAGPRW